ncbi:MAG: hypothetical protein ABSD64_14835 [Terriglobales bacterium]|jgi:hypothetical protein
MTKLPWIFQIAGAPSASNFVDARDMHQSEDPLGAVVEMDANGLVVAGATKITDVRQETTDDN